MENQYELKNDILIVAYFMEKGGWNAVSKANFQRVLYFAAVLSPAFLKDYEWTYGFYNTMYGPINKDLTTELEELFAKGLLSLVNRKITSNRVEEKYVISIQGKRIVENVGDFQILAGLLFGNVLYLMYRFFCFLIRFVCYSFRFWNWQEQEGLAEVSVQ